MSTGCRKKVVRETVDGADRPLCCRQQEQRTLRRLHEGRHDEATTPIQIGKRAQCLRLSFLLNKGAERLAGQSVDGEAVDVGVVHDFCALGVMI